MVDHEATEGDRPADVCAVPLQDGKTLLVRTDTDVSTDDAPTCTLGSSEFRKWLQYEFDTVDASPPAPRPRCKYPGKPIRGTASRKTQTRTRAPSSSGLGCIGLVCVFGCGMPPADAYSESATRLLYEVFQCNPRVRDWATVLKAIDGYARSHAGK
jgi:hypothetical protein